MQNNGDRSSTPSYEASYTGIVPDTFKDEAEVVLKGELDARRLPRRPERHHGEVPVEVRSGEEGRDRPEAVMASLGSFLLLATFVVCSYAAVVSVVGARRGSRRLIESGIGAFYLIAALMTVRLGGHRSTPSSPTTSRSSTSSHYSDSVQPLFYKITSYWGGLDGSIMFWVFLLSVFGALAVYVNRERHRELIPVRRRHHLRRADVLPVS